MSAQEETNPVIETPVTTDPVATETNRDEQGRFKNPVQPRIDELTRKARENEREAAYWRQRAEAKEAKEAEAQAKTSEKPTPDKFDDYGAYVEALTDWKADQRAKTTKQEITQEREQERVSESKKATWSKRSETARTKYIDFDDVLSASTVRINQHVTDVLDESDHGADILYQIAQDPSIADRLNSMSPHRAAMEIGRMESKIPVSATPDPEEPTEEIEAPEPKVQVRKTTSAPPPVKPIAKGGSTAVDLNKLRGDDYVKARQKQGAVWARR